MANVRSHKVSFGGGEISPEMFGRLDDAKYASGLATCRNFIIKPTGPAQNRAGFAFVREVKDSTKKVRLIPFTFNTDQTMIIEMGAGYFRFHTLGATLTDAGGFLPYEISNPYAEADLFDIHYVQSADVLTLVHPSYEPRELRRLGPIDWTLEAINMTPYLAAPAGVTATAAGHTEDKYTYDYVVTSVSADGITESVASAEASDAGNLFETGATVTIAWSAVTGASRYNVYKKQGGVYGYIGSTTGLSIIDDNIAPDLSLTPPIWDNVFSMAGEIQSVEVTNGGALYGSTCGAITTVTVHDSLYYTAIPDSVTMSDPTGAGCVLTPNWAEEYPGAEIWHLGSVVVTAGGSGYTNPTVSINGGTQHPDWLWQQGHSNSFTVAKNPNQVTLKVTDAGGGSGALLQAVVTEEAISGVNVLNPGSGYVDPVVTVDYAGGGAGALLDDPVLTSTGDYPGAVSYYEQRRVFGGSRACPQNIWMTRSGTETNFAYSLPIRDDDRISFRVAAREANTIRHIVPLTQLILLTAAAEWRVTSINNDALTPSSIAVQPQSYIGASNVQPQIVNNTLIYGAARGGHVREMAFSWQASGFITGDLSLRAAHLFDNFEILDMAYAKAPIPILWFVSDTGYLLGLTYVPEQQVGAWHWHDTDGTFESCAVVAEGREDVLYVVVQRTINGADVRYIERMASRQFVDQEDAFFVDSGLTYDGAPADEISGLDHLEGCTVNILADGAVHPPQLVTGGKIVLDVEASTVQVGLPITADIQTLPLALQVDAGFGQGRMKNINKGWLRVYRSSGIWMGPDVDHLVEAKQRTTELYGDPPALKSEEIPLVLSPSWTDGGQVCVRQTDPLPLTIVSMTLEVSLGG